MTKRNLNEMQRREFLGASSVSLLSSLLMLEATGIESTARGDVVVPDEPPPTNVIQVGYHNPQITRLLQGFWVANPSLATWSATRSEVETSGVELRAQRKDLEQANLAVITSTKNLGQYRTLEGERMLARASSPKPNIVTAKRISTGDSSFRQRKARVDLLAMFAADDYWKENDQGSLMVKVGFDEYKDAGTCQRVSNATVGAKFAVARKNSLVPGFETGKTIVTEVGVTKGVRFSFNLIDIYDVSDRTLGDKILEAVNLMSVFHRTGELVGAALPFALAGSAMLDLFGIHILNTNKSNRQIWQFTSETTLEPGQVPGTPKLLPGYYFIGGFSKYEKKRDPTGPGLPIWENLMVSGPGGEGGGDPVFLYRFDRETRKLIPADFSYLVMSVQYAS